MSSHCNPSVVEDGLVFLYDVDDIQSYKGEPTENIFLNPTFIGTSGTQTSTITDNWFFSGYTGDTGFKFYNNSTSPIPLKFSNEGAVITTGASPDNQNRRFYCNEVLEAGATYTVSAWIYITRTSGVSIAHFEYGGATLNNGYFSSTSTHPNHAVGEWYYWEDTYTVGADYTNGLIGPVHTGSSDTILGIQRFQIEKKSHATPFVNGTRSATQGLLDRTGNSTINISNTSFDSNAQMTFDGTDDDIDVGAGTSTSYQRTIEMVFKTNSLASYTPLACYTRGGGQSVVSGKRMWLGFQSNKFQMHGWGTTDPASTTTIQTGKYYHAVYAYDQTTKKHYIWINGVLENNSTNSQSGFTGWDSSGDHKWFVGGDPDCASWFASAGRSLNGEIPIFKVYDKILSNEEVLQNYKSIKSRFNL